MIGSGCHAQSLAGQVAADLYVVGDSGKILVLMGSAVIVGAVIGIVIRPVLHDGPVVSLPPEGKGVLDTELLRGQAIQALEIDHIILPEHQVHVALGLLGGCNGYAPEGVAV